MVSFHALRAQFVTNAGMTVGAAVCNFNLDNIRDPWTTGANMTMNTATQQAYMVDRMELMYEEYYIVAAKYTIKAFCKTNQRYGYVTVESGDANSFETITFANCENGDMKQRAHEFCHFSQRLFNMQESATKDRNVMRWKGVQHAKHARVTDRKAGGAGDEMAVEKDMHPAAAGSFVAESEWTVKQGTPAIRPVVLRITSVTNEDPVLTIHYQVDIRYKILWKEPTRMLISTTGNPP